MHTNAHDENSVSEISYPMKFSTYYTALINNTGAGTLKVAEGGKITANAAGGVAIYSVAGNVTVDGGEVAASGNAIRMVDNDGNGATGNVNIVSGKVKADDVAINVSSAYRDTTFFGYPLERNGTASVRVSGGEVTGGNRAIEADNCVVTVSGTAAIEATAAEGIGVNFTGNGRLAITGGTIKGDAALVQSSDVTIQGGTLIGKYNGIIAARNVTVSGGKVETVQPEPPEPEEPGEEEPGEEEPGETVPIEPTDPIYGVAINADGNVTVTGGTVAAEVGTAIQVGGNVNVSGGVITGTANTINAHGEDELGYDEKTVKTAKGHVTVSGGTIKTTGESVSAIATRTGSITVSGGTIEAPGENSAALDSLDGNILVTGGSVSGSLAIWYGEYGAAVVAAGTCTGDFDAGAGLIVEVTPAFGSTIDAALHLTDEGLEPLEGSETAEAVWDCTGSKAVIQVTLDSGKVVRFTWGNISGIVLSNGTAVRTADETANVSFNTGIGGAAYYFVQDAGDPAIGKPTAEELADDWTKLADVTPGAVKDKAVTLPDAGAKDIYVVVVDGAGNISFPLKIYAAAFAQKYNVVVTNGKVTNGGGGTSFAADEPVFISAVVPEGKKFLKWTVVAGDVELEDENNPSTKFTMPGKSVTVRADFEDVPDKPCYILSTKYVSNFWNWFKFIVLFGWIWMWFIPPTR